MRAYEQYRMSHGRIKVGDWSNILRIGYLGRYIMGQCHKLNFESSPYTYTNMVDLFLNHATKWDPDSTPGNEGLHLGLQYLY